MKKYNALLIAKYIVNWCDKNDIPVSNLRLQKLLYIIQNHLLKERQSYIIDDFVAWQYGPVAKEVYWEYSCYYNMNIFDDDITGYDFSVIDEFTEKTIIKILKDTQKLTGWDLVDLTHNPNFAWFKIYNNGVGKYKTIPKEMIIEDTYEIN